MNEYSFFLLNLTWGPNLICEVNKMIIMKSYFLSEKERLELEEHVLKANKELSEAEILKLDDRELTELARSNRK
jgi:hypothetical protein